MVMNASVLSKFANVITRSSVRIGIKATAVLYSCTVH